MTVDTTVTVLEIQEEKIPEITDEWLERSGRGFILRETAERYAATEYLLEHAGVEIAER